MNADPFCNQDDGNLLTSAPGVATRISPEPLIAVRQGRYRVRRTALMPAYHLLV
jgi:hypothetical protein